MEAALLEDRRELRARLAELLSSLGPPAGPGWADQAVLDREELLRRERLLQEAFRRHEELAGGRAPAARRAALDSQRRAIGDLLKLLEAVTRSCGCRVHGLRFVMLRLAADVEAHLALEEELE